jgi:hypothetical protein
MLELLLLLLKLVIFISVPFEEIISRLFIVVAKFEARKKATIPLNSKNEPLRIIKIEIIVIPIGRFLLIKNFVIYIWIYKYIISKYCSNDNNITSLLQ